MQVSSVVFIGSALQPEQKDPYSDEEERSFYSLDRRTSGNRYDDTRDAGM